MPTPPPMTPGELADIASKYFPGKKVVSCLVYQDRYLFAFQNKDWQPGDDLEALDAKICLNAKGEWVPWAFSDPACQEFMHNCKRVDISELQTIQHYGRLGMKWYQHIFGDDDPRAQYNRKGGAKNVKNKKRYSFPDDSEFDPYAQLAMRKDGGEFLKNLPLATDANKMKDGTYDFKLSTINPNWGKDPTYENNCGLCAIAYEMNRRGYLVEARPKMETSWAEMAVVFQNVDIKKRDTTEDLSKLIQSMPDGARGILGVEWKGMNFGHFCNFEKVPVSESNEYGFIICDGQGIDYAIDDKEIDDYFGKVSSFRVMRTDNCPINPNYIQSAVKPQKKP